jgi:hypothetical protein
MDGFVELVRDILVLNGICEDDIHFNKKLQLPGYYRPEKQWDLLVVSEEVLVSAIEFKSQVGPSFSNNLNNRIEEALGSATDIWKAYEEGAFNSSLEPWLGYLFVLEDCDKVKETVKHSPKEPHFEVFPEFKKTSHEERYKLFCKKIVRERKYSGACLLSSPRTAIEDGAYSYPESELNFRNFISGLLGKCSEYLSRKSG